MTSARTLTIAAAALAYHARGWKPVPVSRKTKKPIGAGWQKRPFDPAQFDGNAQNIAIQLGAVSGGLVDVDLDSMLAVGLAPEFLPATDAIFGHPSKPCSHQLYVSDLHTTEKFAVLAFKEFANGRAGQVFVELRTGANGKGATTVFPPSMHESGELVKWVRDGEPARVAGNELRRSVLKLAVACLLNRRYPAAGSRHEGALVLGGMLARAGWTSDDIRHLVEVLARAASDDDVYDRVIGLAPPPIVRHATNEYFEDQDIIGEWIEDRVNLEAGPQTFTLSSVLFTSWKAWCDGQNLKPGSEKTFVEALKDRGFKKVRKAYGRGFEGIAPNAHDGS